MRRWARSLRLARADQTPADEYILHPGLMDGLLQTIVALVPADEGGGRPTLVPYAVEQVRIARELPPLCYAHVRRTGAQCFDVKVTDERGSAVATLKELTFRRMTAPSAPDLYTPVWSPRELDAPPVAVASAGRVLLVELGERSPLTRLLAEHHPDATVAGEADGFAASIAAAPNVRHMYVIAGGEGDAERGLVTFFRLIKALGTKGYARRELCLTLVTSDVHEVIPGDPVTPWAAGLHGLLKAVSKERPFWRVAAIDVSSQDVSSRTVAAIVNEPCESRAAHDVAMRKGLRFVRELCAAVTPVRRGTAFRERGVYMIFGALGGVGFELSLYLSRTFGARLVLLGRSELDAGKRAQIAQIEALGAETIYRTLDVRRPGDVRDAVAAAKQRFGALNGVFHSAMVLVNQPIDELDEETFAHSLLPKVAGSLALCEAVAREPLDFLLFFSSISAIEVNAHQAGYAAGCAFKDSFAHRQRQILPFPVKIINWGYWEPTAASRTRMSEEFRQRLASAGIEPIGVDAGMAVIETVLSQPLPQIVAATLPPRVLEAMGVDRGRQVTQYPETAPRALDHDLIAAAAASAAVEAGGTKMLGGFDALERYSQVRLLDAMQRMGVFGRAGRTYEQDALRRQMGIIDRYGRLFDLMLELLAQAGFLQIHGSTVVGGEGLGTSGLQRELQSIGTTGRALCADTPALTPYVRLVDACLDAYPEVLTGRRDHLGVLFPNGSTSLVEGVYVDNPVAETYNRLVAGAVAQYCGTRLAADASTPLRILEAGAGTGGTTGAVLSALAPFSERVRYVYSDVSANFVKLGRDRLAARYPFTEFASLDLERDPEEQGFPGDSFDLILASNVLHATTRVVPSLTRVKRLLRTNGLLVLNEGLRQRAYIALTFGLITGWWHFTDPAYRHARHAAAIAGALDRPIGGVRVPLHGTSGMARPSGVAVGSRRHLGRERRPQCSPRTASCAGRSVSAGTRSRWRSRRARPGRHISGGDDRGISQGRLRGRARHRPSRDRKPGAVRSLRCRFAGSAGDQQAAGTRFRKAAGEPVV